jgi:Asp/Glu/hydantoin racemase
MLEMLAERRGTFDAAIVAAFGDPGLGGARELFDLPVVGMAEAAMLVACTLGRKFAIVSFAKALEPWFAEIVDWHGLSGRCAAIRMLDGEFRSIDDVQDEKEPLLVDLANHVANDHGADVVILAGAPLAGLARTIAGGIPVPVVEGVSSAVRHAETLAGLKPGSARAGSFAPPPAKSHAGLPEPIGRLLDGRWK